MTLLNSKDSLVMIIDIQDKLLNAVFDKTTVAKKSEIIAKAANILGIPTIVTEQYPKGLGSTVTNLKEVLAEEAQIFEKTSFSALETPEIADAVKASGKKQVILFGVETHICVSQTANALVEAGFDVYVVSDACGSRAEFEYNAGLNRMKDNGVKVISTEIALFEWLRGAKHPSFKEVQSLIK